MLGPSLNWKTCCTSWKCFFPTDTLKLNFCSLKWVLMVYGSCILLQLGDKSDKPHQKVSTVSRKHLWNFLLADHCTAWWRIIISKDWPTAKDCLGGSWGGPFSVSQSYSQSIHTRIINCYFSRLFLWNVSLFSLNQSLFARCIVAPGCTQQEAYSGLIIFWCQRWGDLFAVPTRHMFSILKFAHVTYVAHELRRNIRLKCWKDEFSLHVGGLCSKFFGVYYLKVWEYWQLFGDIAPGTLFLVLVRVALCVYAVQRKSLGMLRSKKGQGLKQVDSCHLAFWFCQNTLQTILCYPCLLYCNHFQ